MEYIYRKSNIRELYVRNNEDIFGINLSHNFFNLLHTIVLKTKLVEFN